MMSSRAPGALTTLCLAGWLLTAAAAAQELARPKTDTEFIGFDGRVFEFPGAPNTFYNILSEGDHQLVAHFVPAYADGDRDATCMEELGFRFKKERVRVKVQEDGSLEVHHNNQTLVVEEWGPLGQNSLLNTLPRINMTISWEHFHADLGHTMKVTTPLLSVLVWAVPPRTEASGMQHRPVLNFQLKLLNQPPDKVHGIVGQTYKFFNQGLYDLPDDLSFQGEGNPADYEVPNLFDEGFKFGEFKPEGQRTKKGRRALEVGADYPLWAKAGSVYWMAQPGLLQFHHKQ